MSNHYLVLGRQLSLGQLIAFRIISGYVTSPLLRLAQIWQNFQSTGLSLERLSDILDSPQEAGEEDRNKDVKGKLVWIGSDALPPEQARPFYCKRATSVLKQG